MKKLLLMLLGVLMALPMMARDFKYTYEGQTLIYDVISESNKTCSLRRFYGDELGGDLIIPAVAIDENGNGYSVIEIGMCAFSGCSSLTSVDIPGTVTTISNSAFSGCSSLSSVTIPDSVTTIGGGVFSHCSNLTSVTILGSVTTIGDVAFYGCSSLSSVALPVSVTTIGNEAFSGCSSLTSVSIPGSVTEIGFGPFIECNNLIEILVEEDNHYYCSVDGVLFDKEQTKLIQFPSGKSEGYTIPNSVTEICSHAFYGCRGLSFVDIPCSVTTIGEGAFFRCWSLTSVSIPVSVTTIWGFAFTGCRSLTSVTIPGSVNEIGTWAFYGCMNLTSVYYNVQEPIEARYDVFNNDNYENATLYVPAAAVEKCKLIDPWRNFSSIEAHGFTGINDVSADIDSSLPCEVYTTGGVKVGYSTDGLAPGIYIVRQGNTVKKIAVN